MKDSIFVSHDTFVAVVFVIVVVVVSKLLRVDINFIQKNHLKLD